MKHIFRHPKVKGGVRWVVGWLFILLGVIGCFLPILQGVLFLAIGAFLLAPYIPLFARMRDRLYRRFPRAEQLVLRMKRSWHHARGDY